MSENTRYLTVMICDGYGEDMKVDGYTFNLDMVAQRTAIKHINKLIANPQFDSPGGSQDKPAQ